MDLPKSEIGVSDLINHTECPRRMRFGMERHTPREYTHPETGKPLVIRERPEAEGENNAFGSSFHDAAELIETELLTIEQAVQIVFPSYSQWLSPGDLALLKKDLEALQSRDYRGVRTVVAEDDCRVPLTEHEGETIYFRFKLDRLYQSVQNPGRFIQIDYKSSKWQKSQAEWNADIQQWAYNWGVYEVFPECDDLMQVVDQLRFGPVTLDRKSAEQREQIREWLAAAAVAVIEDEDHLPKFNQWCAWCPLIADCPVIEELTDFARTEIGVIAPVEKDGRKKKVALDVLEIDDYVARLERATEGRKVLEKFEEAVKGALKRMPEENRSALGYGLAGKNAYYFPRDVLVDVHEVLGDDFYRLVTLPKTKLESHLSDDPETLAKLLEMMEVTEGAVSVVKT